MGRFFLFLGLLAVAVALAVFLLSIWRGFYAAGQNLVGPMLRATEGELMTPNGIQKVAYAALLVLLFGLSTGVIGGL